MAVVCGRYNGALDARASLVCRASCCGRDGFGDTIVGDNASESGAVLPDRIVRLSSTLADPSNEQIKLAFHDNFCDRSFHILWDEVRKKQEDLNLTDPSGDQQRTMDWCEQKVTEHNRLGRA
jgi:hypothetical protein